jgi:NAD(P)-dependent dehydrogenase (short-subunit alcohol dehydrogenase family)
MKENSYGRIVMTSSIAGILGNFGQSNYGAAKMGLVGLTNVLKIEGAKYNIKVNVLAPNAGTRLTEDVLPPEVFEQFKVEYVTPPVLYLCSEQCQDSGMIIHNVKNYYNRFAVVMGPGVTVPEGPEGVPTPEDVMENWEKVLSLENAKYYNDVNDLFGQLGDMMLVKP